MDELERFEAILDRVTEQDRRYARPAYLFVQRALHFYKERYGGGEGGHLKGEQVLSGVRELALAVYGPMARSVLNDWGVVKGEDVGEIVYNLIDAGLMKKTPEDNREDFAGIMDFDEAMDGEAGW
jgi:uncharacterized repeat protein (TIGR04138 family)